MTVDQAEGPLAGLLVADFSRILAGPYATMLLADMGAEVVKVEGPGGDDTRTWQPPVRDGISTYYLSVNRNKRSIAVDMAHPEGADLVRRLVQPGLVAAGQHQRHAPVRESGGEPAAQTRRRPGHDRPPVLIVDHDLLLVWLPARHHHDARPRAP